MGVVVVGPSGSGKTTLWRILRLALAKVNQVVKQYVMNPKAIPRTQVCQQQADLTETLSLIKNLQKTSNKIK